jgi:hypothetical protein
MFLLDLFSECMPKEQEVIFGPLSHTEKLLSNVHLRVFRMIFEAIKLRHSINYNNNSFDICCKNTNYTITNPICITTKAKDCPYSCNFYVNDITKHRFFNLKLNNTTTFRELLTMAFQVYGIYVNVNDSIHVYIPNYTNVQYKGYYINRVQSVDQISVEYDFDNNNEVILNNDKFNILNLISSPFTVLGVTTMSDTLNNLNIHKHRYLYCCFALNEMTNKHVIKDISDIIIVLITELYYSAYFY